jgi:RHS repeat-associated protein
LASVNEDLDPLSALDSPLSTSYGYDVLGNMSRTDLPNGVITAYDYDQLNRLDVMTDYAPDGSASLGSPDLDLSDNQKLAEYDYEVRADGKRTSAKETFWLDAYNYGTPEPHVNHINWTYDDIGRLTDEVFNHFDDNLDQTEHFVYDLTGNRISKTVDKGNDASIEEAITYSYDANDRLLEEVLDDLTDDANDRTTTYGYDHTQLTSKTVSDALNSQLSTLNYVYNLQGRMAEVTTTEASGKVTVTSFEYDATGIRIASTHKIDADGDGTFESQVRIENLVDHHNFTGYQQSIRETHTDLLTGKITKTVEYTYGHDEIAQTVTEFNPDGTVASEVTHIFGHDGHVSVRVLYDSAASILQLFAYSSYGEMLGIHDGQAAFIGIEESLALTILLYSGEPYYQQIAMQYLRRRWYDAETGRLNRADDFGGDMQDPQSLHKYLYAHGDPIAGIDPTGRFSVTISLAGMSFSANIRLGSAKAKITAGYLAIEKASTAFDIAQIMLQIALTGTVNPIDVAFIAFDLLPGSKILKRIKAFVPSFGPGLNTGRKAMQNSSGLLTRISRNIDEFGINAYKNANGATAKAVAITNRLTEKVGELGGGFVGRSLGLAKETRYVKNGVHGFDDVLKKGDQWFILEAKGGTSTLAPRQMSRDWIQRNINKLPTNSPLRNDLQHAFNNDKLFGLVTETRIDQATGTVLDPEYFVKSITQIGGTTF